MDRIVMTAAAGTFRIDGVPLGAGILVARRPGYVAVERAISIIAEEALVVELQLLAVPQQLDSVAVTAQRPRPFLLGYVHDLDGRPLENVEILLGGLTRTVMTNARGAFRFDSLNDKDYQLTARLPGYAAGHALVPVGEGEPTEVAIRMRQLPQEIPEYFVDGVRQRGLYGVVGTPELQPVVGANVRVHGGGTSKSTDSTGWFAFPNVKPGDYLVEATFDGLTGRPIHVNVPRGGSREIVITLEPKGQGWEETRGLSWAYRDLGLTLSFQPARHRMARAELARYKGRQLCDVARVRREVGGRDEAVIIVDGLRALNLWSLCAFNTDELALVQFGGACQVLGLPVKVPVGYRCIKVWTR